MQYQKSLSVDYKALTSFTLTDPLRTVPVNTVP